MANSSLLQYAARPWRSGGETFARRRVGARDAAVGVHVDQAVGVVAQHLARPVEPDQAGRGAGSAERVFNAGADW